MPDTIRYDGGSEADRKRILEVHEAHWSRLWQYYGQHKESGWWEPGRAAGPPSGGAERFRTPSASAACRTSRP